MCFAFVFLCVGDNLKLTLLVVPGASTCAPFNLQPNLQEGDKMSTREGIVRCKQLGSFYVISRN